MLRAEGTGQKLAQEKSAPWFAEPVAENDDHVIRAKLSQLLTTAAAGRYEPIAGPDDSDLDTSAAASQDHSSKRGRFCAHAFGEGSIFDVAAGVNAIPLVTQGGTNGELRIGRISPFLRRQSGVNQIVRRHQSSFT
jgi:hypothetical protein